MRWRTMSSRASMLVACMAVMSPALAQDAPRLADTMEQRMAACAICHGVQGEGRGAAEYYPRIGGKPAGYLFAQLQHFRDGRRRYPQMVYLMRYMPDAYLRDIADYYAKLQPPYPAPSRPSTDARERQRGATLATSGDAARNVPACTSCHGQALTGMSPGVPGLVGLPVDYIAAQLGAWKAGLRVAAAPDCMHDIAQRLSGADIAAIAKWLGSQAVPAGALQFQPSAKLPLRCGSQPS
jgi:cytochrome c553